MLKYFVAIYERGPAWVKNRPLREQPLSAHVDYLTTLHGDGCVIMGGPFADGGGGLVVFATDSSEAADEVLANDPAIETGILKAVLHEWDRIV